MASPPADKDMGINILGKMEFNTASDFGSHWWWAKRGQNTSLCASQTHQYLASQTISHNHWYKVQRWVVVHGICLDVEVEQDVAQVTRWSLLVKRSDSMTNTFSSRRSWVFDGVKNWMKIITIYSSNLHETYLYIILVENMFLKTIDMVLVCLSPRQCMIHLDQTHTFTLYHWCISESYAIIIIIK